MTTINSENPFVKNEYYYPNSIPFNTTTFYLLHKISNNSAFVIGILLAFLLVFLIAFKTPHSFRAYSKMLIICVITDFVILFADFLCQSRVRIAEGVIVISLNGPFSQLPYKRQCNGMILQSFAATLTTAVLPIQYFYRYITLKRRRSPTSLQTFLYYCLAVCVVSVFALLSTKAYDMDPIDLPDFDYARLWYEEKPIPPLVIGSIRSKWMLVQIIYLGLFLVACYSLTVWLAKQTIKELDAQEHELTERTKSLQRQFSRTLLVQALTPLFTSVIPLALIFIAMSTGSSTGYAGEFIILVITWFPVLNSLSNIVFIVPYRRYCLKCLPGYKRRISSSVAQPSSVFMQQTQKTITVA